MIRLYDLDVLDRTSRTLPIPHARTHIFQGKSYGCDVWSDIAQLPPFWKISFGVTLHLMTSHPVAMLHPVMRNGTLCTTTIVRKMHVNRLCMHTRSLPVTWLPVTSFPVRVASCDVNSGSSSSNATLTVPIYYLPKTLRFEWNSYSTRRMYIWANYSVSSYLNLIPIRVF